MCENRPRMTMVIHHIQKLVAPVGNLKLPELKNYLSTKSSLNYRF